jgi:hypothetical protein
MARQPRARKPGYVYCYQFDSERCFKVGRTIRDPEQRKKAYRAGAPGKLNLYRKISSEDAVLLETYIHKILDHARTENPEVFRVTRRELDDAVEQAEAFVDQFGQILREAENLRRTMPRDTLAEPSPEMFDLYRQLRAETRESFFLQKRIEVLQAKIQVAIGHNSGMKGIASWGWFPRFTIDLESFKANHPDLYEKYKRDSSSRKFLPERLDLSKF